MGADSSLLSQAIEITTGELVACMDHDDLLSRHALAPERIAL